MSIFQLHCQGYIGVYRSAAHYLDDANAGRKLGVYVPEETVLHSNNAIMGGSWLGGSSQRLLPHLDVLATYFHAIEQLVPLYCYLQDSVTGLWQQMHGTLDNSAAVLPEMEQISLFRATTQRLLTTPVDDLPRIAGFLASTLANCSTLFDAASARSTDASVPLHKLRTRISALLQHRSPAGRFTAAVLIKSIAEVSQPAESAILEPWARALIACLSKSDPWEVKRVCLTAVVRIFLLTRDSTTLQRELTTPLLPPLLTATLSAIKPIPIKTSTKSHTAASPLLPAVLQAWDHLIQDHAGTFRPFLGRIQPICSSIASDLGSSKELQSLAIRLLSSLHLCAPKATANSDWESTTEKLIKAAHGSLDLILRGVQEDWYPSDPLRARQSIRHNFAREPELAQVDPAGLSSWQGVYEGSERVSCLLQWLETMLRCRSPPASVPLGLLLELTTRISALATPPAVENGRNHPHHNLEVTKEERETLSLSMPTLYIRCLALFSQIVTAFSSVMTPVMTVVIDQIFDILESGKGDGGVRHQFYITFVAVLGSNSCLDLQFDLRRIEGICGLCCRDVEKGLVQRTPASKSTSAPRNGSGAKLLTPSLTAEKAGRLCQTPELTLSAVHLLPLLLEKMPSKSLSSIARTNLDRVSVLIGDKMSMLASVMNPPVLRSGKGPLPSVIPFLAQVAGDSDVALEAIKRPRMSLASIDTSEAVQENGTSSPQNAQHWMTVESNLPDAPDITDKYAASPSRDKQADEQPEPMTAAPQNDPDSAVATFTSGKRDFSALETNAGQSNSASRPTSVGDAQMPKKARMIEQDSKASTRIPYEFHVVDTQMDVAPQVATSQPVMYGGSIPKPSAVEEDSDSDIPSINPELATDNEEEESEEDLDEVEEAQ